MRDLLIGLAALGLAGACGPGSATEQTSAVTAKDGTIDVLHLSPQGDDTWSGLSPERTDSDGPVATLAGARDRLRAYREQRLLATDRPTRVIIQDGEYFIPTAVILGPEDSGTAEAPVVFEAAPGAHPIATGGVRLTGFTVEEHGVWRLQREDLKASNPAAWQFEGL